jgi:hypothetical protein
VADALEHRVRAEAVRQLADALDRLVTTLADNIRGAELSGERDPVRVTTEKDELLRSKPFGRNHPAQTDGAIADDRRGLAGTDVGGGGRHGGPFPSRRRE